jgi:hypothetical protein
LKRLLLVLRLVLVMTAMTALFASVAFGKPLEIFGSGNKGAAQFCKETEASTGVTPAQCVRHFAQGGAIEE